jgi:quercetin dioxygenase-like cupin family protein
MKNRIARGGALTALVLLILGGIGVPDTVAVSGQELPPTIRASRDFTDLPRQYDLMQMLFELGPGAAVPSHKVNGKSIISVLTGEVSRIEENGETTVFRAGETLTETSEDHFDVDLNTGKEPALLLATFLLSPGTEPLLLNPNAAPSSAPGPKFVAVARTTVGTIPARFTLTHAIFDVPAGLDLPPHTHDAWNLVTELSGRVFNIVNGSQQGATFAHGPHDIHEVTRNAGPPVRAMSATVGPVGAPALRFLTVSAPQAQPIVPPSTGDGGLADAR